MACCGGKFYDGEAAPACSDLEEVEANGFVELKVKRRAKLFKRSEWRARYCVLADDRLYLYKDMKGKSYDPETFVIDLRDTLKISVRSYVAREPSEEMNVTAAGCVMTITDRYKRKHKLRFGTGEERQYWTGHLSKASGKDIGGFDDKHAPSSTISRMMQQIETQSDGHQVEDESFCNQDENEERAAFAASTKNASAEDLAVKRRNVDEFVQWLNQRDSMLKRRQRDLCDEIESILPFRRARSTSDLNTAIAISDGDGPQSDAADRRAVSDGGPETVIVENLDDVHSVEDSECLLSSSRDAFSSIMTAVEVVPSLIEEEDGMEPLEMKRPDADVVKVPKKPESARTPPPPPPPRQFPSTHLQQQASSHPPPIITESNQSLAAESGGMKKVSAMITKMQELLVARDRSSMPLVAHNLRTLTGTIGTVQFPAYRRAPTGRECSPMASPPPSPKWWGTVDKLAAAKPEASTTARFKFDRSTNPVWKAIHEKSLNSDVMMR